MQVPPSYDSFSHSSWWSRSSSGFAGTGRELTAAGRPGAAWSAARNSISTTAEAISSLRHCSGELWFTRPPA
ncbi:hypothetical protein ACWEQ1_35280 [Streptomyces nodosus]